MAEWVEDNEFGYFEIELIDGQLLYTVSATALGYREIGAENRTRQPVTLEWLRACHQLEFTTLDAIEQALTKRPSSP